MPKDSSQLYSRNVFNLLNHIYSKGDSLNVDDEITNGSMLINGGEVNNDTFKQFLNKDH